MDTCQNGVLFLGKNEGVNVFFVCERMRNNEGVVEEAYKRCFWINLREEISNLFKVCGLLRQAYVFFNDKLIES